MGLTRHSRVQKWVTRLSWLGILEAFLALAVLALAFWRLNGVPPLWWDEGWNLSVARNWVVLGHFGRLLMGEPASAQLNGGFPLLVPLAFSFRLFGVGLWQARLPFALYTLGALGLLYWLAKRLYGTTVAGAALLIVLLMTPFRQLNPLLIGRQAMGEIPSTFYLFGGYLCLLLAFRKPFCLLLAVLAWGLALMSKMQVLPFLATSLVIPLAIAACRQRWRVAVLVGSSLFGSWGASELLARLGSYLLRGHVVPVNWIPGLTQFLALVPMELNARLSASVWTFAFGLPTVLGLAYAAHKAVRTRAWLALDDGKETTRLALLGLTASWLGWYLFLSIGWPRYLFQVTFFGSLFFAALLADLTRGFQVMDTLKSIGYGLTRRSRGHRGALVLVSLLLVLLMGGAGSFTLYQSYVVNADDSVLQTVDFLNTQTPTGAVVETYESQLFFLLDRRYHYPPDDIFVPLERRYTLDSTAQVDYDPLAANPDYLVVGPYARPHRLYDQIIAAGRFALLKTIGSYEIYHRQR